ncbi:hypothetical protein V1520DRAFT_393601 [Lipomyces starkeyi]|uniref:Uncharacterized protein n=1 Tax=Lipomyces starkeyi NRRL Y-11557 TaxID=675824 RepID=A0A1E3Q1M0_LIPST|nr:hypothetical protein LIPSTDRAFT_4655 [Lipomyces starkeyi NRRL Y-11557]
MPRKSLRQAILGDVEYALEILLMLRAGRRNLVERILDKHKHLEAIEDDCREMFVIADLLRKAGQESAVDDFLDDYLLNTQMGLMKSLLKLAVHASQKYYLSNWVAIPRSQEQHSLLTVCTPDMRMINYVVGIRGSCPDCVCFKGCMIYRLQEQLLKSKESIVNTVTDEDDDDDAKARAEDLRVGKEKRDYLRAMELSVLEIIVNRKEEDKLS